MRFFVKKFFFSFCNVGIVSLEKKIKGRSEGLLDEILAKNVISEHGPEREPKIFRSQTEQATDNGSQPLLRIACQTRNPPTKSFC